MIRAAFGPPFAFGRRQQMAGDILTGGRSSIVLTDKVVTRPAGAWTLTVHKFLHALRLHGFASAPEPIGAEGADEQVSYLAGQVFHALSGAAASEAALASAARLLRSFHDGSRKCLADFGDDSIWMLPERRPAELICHGDFAPYNVVFGGEDATGLIDFDTAHPGPVLWDLAYGVYRWAPISDPAQAGVDFAPAQQWARARIFLDAYGLQASERVGLADAMIARLEALVSFMRSRAAGGDETFAGHIRLGHDAVYLRDIAYIEANRKALLGAVTL